MKFITIALFSAAAFGQLPLPEKAPPVRLSACPAIPAGYKWVEDRSGQFKLKELEDLSVSSWRLFDSRGESRGVTWSVGVKSSWRLSINRNHSEDGQYYATYETLEAAKCGMARYLRGR